MSTFIDMLKPYNKFLVAILGAVAQVAAVNYGGDHRVQIALSILTALGVYTVKNKEV